ncbi:MAG: hypothetical protein R6V83_12960 [Candidatus Thorarchaeota archaeon]
MDFTVATFIAALATSVFLGSSLIIYGRSVLSIREQVSSDTLYALILFGGAGVSLAGMAITSAFYTGTIATRPWVILFFVFFIVSLVQVITDEKKIHYATYATGVIASGGAILVALTSPTEISPILGFALYVSAAVALVLSCYLLWDSPSPFSAGTLVLLGAFLFSWFSIITGIVQRNPEYFLIIYLPALIDAAILSAMLKPWRRMITLLIFFLAITIGMSIFGAAFLAGDYEIWLFTIFALIASLSAIGATDFFVEEFMETGAKIPGYISALLIGLALLIANHTIYFGIFQTYGYNDWNLLYLEWVIGVLAAGAYVLIAFQPLMSAEFRKYARRAVLVFMSIMIILGNEYVKNGRWVYDNLFPVLLAFIAVGVVGYVNVVRTLRKSGNTSAAINFTGLMTGTLATAFVIEYSDNLPLIVTLILLLVAAIMVYQSSPRRFSFLTE